MMRRSVDSTVSLAVCIAVLPASLNGGDLPDSITSSMGDFSEAWARVLCATCLMVLVGIWLRKRRPALSYVLEYAGCITVGITASAYGVAVYILFGASQGWIALWFALAIGGFHLARFVELWVSHRRAVKYVAANR